MLRFETVYLGMIYIIPPCSDVCWPTCWIGNCISNTANIYVFERFKSKIYYWRENSHWPIVCLLFMLGCSSTNTLTWLTSGPHLASTSIESQWNQCPEPRIEAPFHAVLSHRPVFLCCCLNVHWPVTLAVGDPPNNQITIQPKQVIPINILERRWCCNCNRTCNRRRPLRPGLLHKNSNGSNLSSFPAILTRIATTPPTNSPHILSHKEIFSDSI